MRSRQSDQWHDPGTWERYDGDCRTSSSSAPSVDDGSITVRDGHQVIVSVPDSTVQLVIVNGGELVVNPGVEFKIKDGIAVEMLVEGAVINYGTIGGDVTAEISFYGNGRYGHKQNGGTIPSFVWRANSMCLIEGVTDAAPTNGRQDFHNIIWNCPEQTGDKSLNWNGAIIGGVTVNRGSQNGTGMTL